MRKETQKLILYDGKCAFCNKIVGFVQKRDKKKAFICMPVQNQESRKALKSIGVHFVNLNTIYLLKNESVYIKSEAVFLIFSELPFPYRIISAFRILPKRFSDLFYDLVAKYRYKLSALIK